MAIIRPNLANQAPIHSNSQGMAGLQAWPGGATGEGAAGPEEWCAVQAATAVVSAGAAGKSMATPVTPCR